MEWRSSTLGWQGVDPNSEQVNTLRQQLVAKNGGINNLRVDDYARIAECFYRDGFVVVHSVITGEGSTGCKSIAMRSWLKSLIVIKQREATGLSSLLICSTSTTGAQLHHEGWFQLIEHPVLNAIVRALFQSDDRRSVGRIFACRALSITNRSLRYAGSNTHALPNGNTSDHSDPEGLIITAICLAHTSPAMR